MGFLLLSVLLFLWVAPALLAASLAARSGRSYGLWLFLGLMLGLIALAIAACFRPVEAVASPAPLKSTPSPEPAPLPPVQDRGLSAGTIITAIVVMALMVVGLAMVGAPDWSAPQPLPPVAADQPDQPSQYELQSAVDAAQQAVRDCVLEFSDIGRDVCVDQKNAATAAEQRLYDFEHGGAQ